MSTKSNIIDGKAISKQVRLDIKKQVEILSAEINRKPNLSVILVGDDPASEIYVRLKHKACEELGIQSSVYTMSKETTEKELLDKVKALNLDDKVDGILVQMPVPKQISPDKVINAIDPMKDVDCFHPENVGLLFAGVPRFLPCTPNGVMKLIESTGISISGKHAVVVGRSNIVGKPLAMMLLQENATVTICHSKTKNLVEIASSADILVGAVGRAKMITRDMVKDGAVVVDVGINRTADGIFGDIDFENVVDKAGFITPVPGGVGPMTITMLMDNTLKACKLRSNV